MSNTVDKEELLEWIKRQKWFIKSMLNEYHRTESWVESDERAYGQIVQIIKLHFSGELLNG